MMLGRERPVLFIGHGVTLSEAGKELTAFAHRLGIPVISSPNGMGCLDMTDPLSLGFIGRNGAYPANEAGRHADRGDGHRRALRRPLGVVLAARLLLELPAHQADPRRRRSAASSAATIRPTSASWPMRAPSCASCWPRSTGAGPKRDGTLRAWHADIERWTAA